MTTQQFSKPLPNIDEDSKPFWDYCKQHELRVQKCLNCGKLHYPPSGMCPHCLHPKCEWVKISGKGQVYSFIIVRRPYHPSFAKEIPYTVAIIETDEGMRMLSNVVQCKPEAVKVGMPVEVVFEAATEEFVLPKFKPLA
jgi:uncharacterized protein